VPGPSLTGIGNAVRREKRRRFLESKGYFRSDELCPLSRLNIAAAGSLATPHDIAGFPIIFETDL
jgi:hypothetical protein